MSEDFLLCSKIFVAILFAFVRRKKKNEQINKTKDKKKNRNSKWLRDAFESATKGKNRMMFGYASLIRSPSLM